MLTLLAIAQAFALELGPSLDGAVAVGAAEVEVPAQDTGGAWGSCSDQSLRDGVQLPALPFFYSRIAPNDAWGTPTLVDLVIAAGRHMSWTMPKASPFAVGDLSRRFGGPSVGHISHRGGVDADIGLYRQGGFQARNQFLDLAPSQVDLAATWELMRFFLDSGMVDFILLDRAHIVRIKAFTLSQGLLTHEEAARVFPVEGSREAWQTTGIVRHAAHHRDHMHVRVLCADGTRAGF
ncbi:MAG: hypothetical protein RLZZ299_2418 [Pseudomonadota bacterium]